MRHVGVTVVGSVNLDLVAALPRLPGPGETLTAAGLTRVPGGKGANQALAVHRLGLPVQLIAAVGPTRRPTPRWSCYATRVWVWTGYRRSPSRPVWR
jgi:ribokinase